MKKLDNRCIGCNYKFVDKLGSEWCGDRDGKKKCWGSLKEV